MDKKVYLSRFSKLVRWRLPADEAEEVIDDYTELLTSYPEGGTALVKALGDPEVAVKLLGITGEYACWMTTFSVICISLLYFLFELLGGLSLYYIGRINYFFHLDSVLFYLSMGLIILWKWKSPKRKGRCPGLLPTILGMLFPAAMLAASWGFLYYLYTIDFSIDWPYPIFKSALYLAGFISFAAALAGLIQYRIRDRRWLIVTAMAVTILFVSMELFLLISSLDNKDAVLPAMRYIMRHVIAGTVGVSWTLCC